MRDVEDVVPYKTAQSHGAVVVAIHESPVFILAYIIGLSCLRRHTFLYLKEKYAKEPNQRARPLETLRLKHGVIGCSDHTSRRIPIIYHAVVIATL